MVVLLLPPIFIPAHGVPIERPPPPHDLVVFPVTTDSAFLHIVDSVVNVHVFVAVE